jgi:transposase-like protein
MTQAQRDIRKKLKVFEYADEVGNISKVCRHLGISQESYYRWKKALRSYRKLIRAELPRPTRP